MGFSEGATRGLFLEYGEGPGLQGLDTVATPRQALVSPSLSSDGDGIQ